MTILIKGMKMPENCYQCRFYNSPCAQCRIIGRTYMNTSNQPSIRPEWCPLVEVPTPHGRLIDADAIFEQWYQLNFDRKISDGTLAYWNVLLGKAPTVMEAEGPKE